MWLAGGIFFITYTLIVTERVHRTVSGLLGGVAMILFGVVSQEEAFLAIDWNVIFLLVGMMVIASVMAETGLFQWIALQAVKLGRGSPFRVLVILSAVIALTSALLDNVTIVVLAAPVALFVATSIRVSPLPFLISGVLASNIGGTATLVGDPPNILIGSAADIDFLTFTANLAPISILILSAFLVLSWFLFQNDLRPARGPVLNIAALDTGTMITDKPLLLKALVVMSGVVAGFLTHRAFHLEPATIALAGAAILLLWARHDPHVAFQDVEWTTLFFFIGLFITVEAIVKVGIIRAVAEAALALTGGSLPLTSMLLLWLSAIVSGIVDNIPYTATMIPVVENLGRSMPIMPLWWSLALGACLGGNLTLVGAAANVVVANLAAKSGHPISFKRFLGYGAATTLLSLLLSTVYVWLRYL
ncbi:MAG TPA: ArsB/NhaD family transporter [Anaerolineae bacterium]|nr:ArsB/NhaD family transporter [Anaerolineae bacterium]